jgi:hypothetical protein
VELVPAARDHHHGAGRAYGSNFGGRSSRRIPTADQLWSHISP